jgi:hypothetical protein
LFVVVVVVVVVVEERKIKRQEKGTKFDPLQL